MFGDAEVKRRAQAENRLEWQLAQWITPKVLVVDELGYLPMSREEANLFFPAGGPPLRACQPHHHFQQEFHRLG